MVAYARGDVVSFRITDEFTKKHLEHLKKIGGTKSRTIAKYCAKGITMEMEGTIVICAKELPVEIREWLSNKDNIHLLVATLCSLQSQDNNAPSKSSSEQPKVYNSVDINVAPKVVKKPLEIRLKDNLSDDLNDFLEQLI